MQQRQAVSNRREITKKSMPYLMKENTAAAIANGGDVLNELEQYLTDYAAIGHHDPWQKERLERRIQDLVMTSKLLEQQPAVLLQAGPRVAKLSEQVTVLETVLHQEGMYIFGKVSESEHRTGFLAAIIRAVVRQDSSLERLVAELMGLDVASLQISPSLWHKRFGKTYGELLQDIHYYAKGLFNRLS